MERCGLLIRRFRVRAPGALPPPRVAPSLMGRFLAVGEACTVTPGSRGQAAASRRARAVQRALPGAGRAIAGIAVAVGGGLVDPVLRARPARDRRCGRDPSPEALTSRSVPAYQADPSLGPTALGAPSPGVGSVAGAAGSSQSSRSARCRALSMTVAMWAEGLS